MRVPLIPATFKEAHWMQCNSQSQKVNQFLVVKSLKNDDAENVDAEIEKYLYGVDPSIRFRFGLHHILSKTF
jgi:hypothetical protein